MEGSGVTGRLPASRCYQIRGVRRSRGPSRQAAQTLRMTPMPRLTGPRTPAWEGKWALAGGTALAFEHSRTWEVRKKGSMAGCSRRELLRGLGVLALPLPLGALIDACGTGTSTQGGTVASCGSQMCMDLTVAANAPLQSPG